MAISNWFRRKRVNAEAERRARLSSAGRITDGAIIDTISDDAGAITQIFYRYTVSGVDYESSQLLDQEQQRRPLDYAPGAHVTVRYDPHRPGNSIVV
ncbi:MAG: hypothetical protein QOD00_213 [Blastocatellia bacterium]|jgi:hypothetical protein|nr:hypothetical protein [Blastocatellia bacterium]